MIPIIDFRHYDESHAASIASLAEQVASALTSEGFMGIQNLGIDQSDIERTFEVAEWFFSQELSMKKLSSYAAAGENFGFQEVGIEHLDPTAPADIKETFTMRNLLNHDPADRRWPNDLFRETMIAFYQICLESAYRVQRVCAKALSLEPDYFVQKHQGENVSLRLLYYPADTSYSVAPRQLGAGAHTDYGMLTLLFQNGVGGLEIRDSDGRWQAAEPEADTILINTGDLMERWTNGRFRSTPHRVKSKVGHNARFSIAMFVDPDSATPIQVLDSCLDHRKSEASPLITAGEYIKKRIEASHRRGVPAS